MTKKLHGHCGRFASRPTNRREMLQWCANGFGALALSTLSESSSASASGPWVSKPSHFPGRAKNVIFLYMDGGPSHVDTFDYKPQLEKYDGQDPRKVIGKLAPTQFDAVGKVLKSQWKFSQRGEAGHWMSAPNHLQTPREQPCPPRTTEQHLDAPALPSTALQQTSAG